MNVILIALAIVLTPTALVLTWLYVDSLIDAAADMRRRTEQDRDVTPEWLAVLAATEPTPVYDRLICESMEREEGWVS